MIEKQQELYRIGGTFNTPDLLSHSPKIAIKTELDENCIDEIFCAPFITINGLKQEDHEEPTSNKIQYKKNEVGVSSTEQQKLITVFKKLLKENKNKT